MTLKEQVLLHIETVLIDLCEGKMTQQEARDSILRTIDNWTLTELVGLRRAIHFNQTLLAQ